MEISRRSLLIAAGAGAALCLVTSRAWAADPPTPRPRDAELDLSQVVIVAPEEAEWQAVGQSLAEAIAGATGASAPTVRTPQQERFASGWSGHTIELGHLGNNVEIARLYGMRFAMVDSWFPGASETGSYWIRTLVDPFGSGGNTLVLGVSDLTGAEAAVAALTAELDGTTLPMQHAVRISDELRESLYDGGTADPDYVAAKRAEFEDDLAALKPTTDVEADAVRLHGVLNDTKLMGEAHLLTGEPGFAELAHLLLVGYADFLNTHTEAAMAQLNERTNMWTNGEEFISVWATLEVLDRFTDAERTAILQALHSTYTANARDGYLVGADPEGPRWNHQIFPAMSLVAASDYFQRHHELPEAKPWRELGDMIFHGNTTLISLDDGSDYMMHLPMAIMDYAMFTGQYDFLTAVLRPSADLNVLMIDNGGSIAGGGDVYPYGRSGPYSWGHSQGMNAANWLFDDPIYGVLMERARNGPFSNNQATDLDLPLHRYTVDPPESDGSDDDVERPAVMAYPIDKGVYDTVVAETPSSVEQDRTFHKMTFRAGIEIDEPTLIMDGFSGGTHNHQDGNTIIGYTAQQRILLVDRDYMENMAEHHTGLVVVRDGQQALRPELTRVDWVADVGLAAVSRSTVTDWDDMEWTRTVLTTDGSFHVVLDDLELGAAGSYLVKNQWQTLGTGELDGPRYTCRQQGATMIIDSLDDSVLQTRDRYGHFRKHYRSDYYSDEYWYHHADAETVLSQVQSERQRDAGDRVSFLNVIATGEDDGPDIVTRRDEQRLFQITADGEDWWIVTGPLSGPMVSQDAVVSIFGPDRVSVAGATELDVNGEQLRFEEPVVWALDIEAGHWQAFPVRRDQVRYDEVGEPVRPGPVAEGDISWSPALTARVLREVRMDRTPWRPGKRGLPTVTDQPDGWTTAGTVAGEVTEVAEIVDDEPMVLVGTAEGTVTALAGDGAEQWSVEVGGRVNEISHHVHDEDELITVTTENYLVVALARDGQQRWTTEIPHDVGRRESKGNLIGTTVVRLGYVNGHDDAPWLMVGTQHRWVYGLDWQGAIQHELAFYYYGIQDALFADFDGDGKDEGVLALEYFMPSMWDDGEEHRGGRAPEGPGYTSVDMLAQDDGPPVIVLGTKHNIVQTNTYVDQTWEDGWRTNVGGEVHDLRAGTFHSQVGDEVILGTSGFHALSLKPDGSVRFRTVIGDHVRQVRALADQGYLAAADHGLLVALDTDGAETSRWRFPQPIGGVALSTGDAPVVVLTDGTVLRQG